VTDEENEDKAGLLPRRPLSLSLSGISTRYLEIGERVRAARPLRNDGTYPQKPIGEVLVHEGDVGYVLEIVKFCGETYYTVEFVDRSVVLGTRYPDLIIA